MTSPRPFDTLDDIALRLGVRPSWLRREADEGRIPSFKAGRSTLGHFGDIEQALRERASHRQEAPA